MLLALSAAAAVDLQLERLLESSTLKIEFTVLIRSFEKKKNLHCDLKNN
jgi:hypothetical protein